MNGTAVNRIHNRISTRVPSAPMTTSTSAPLK